MVARSTAAPFGWTVPRKKSGPLVGGRRLALARDRPAGLQHRAPIVIAEAIGIAAAEDASRLAVTSAAMTGARAAVAEAKAAAKPAAVAEADAEPAVAAVKAATARPTTSTTTSAL